MKSETSLGVAEKMLKKALLLKALSYHHIVIHMCHLKNNPILVQRKQSQVKK